MTYGQLRAQVEAFAESLAAIGIGRGDRVGMAFPNGLPAIVSFLKARVALPLFFERALIEISPRRVLYWPSGDASTAPQIVELGKEAA